MSTQVDTLSNMGAQPEATSPGERADQLAAEAEACAIMVERKASEVGLTKDIHTAVATFRQMLAVAEQVEHLQKRVKAESVAAGKGDKLASAAVGRAEVALGRVDAARETAELGLEQAALAMRPTFRQAMAALREDLAIIRAEPDPLLRARLADALHASVRQLSDDVSDVRRDAVMELHERGGSYKVISEVDFGGRISRSRAQQLDRDARAARKGA